MRGILDRMSLGYGSNQRAALRSLVRRGNFYRAGVDATTPVTFTRASTRTDPRTGLSLANNLPSTIDAVIEGMLFRHYLVEPSRTNLALNSVLAGTAPVTSWSESVSGTASRAVATARIGGNIAYTFTAASGRVTWSQTISVSASTKYYFSVYINSISTGISPNQLILVTALPVGATVDTNATFNGSALNFSSGQVTTSGWLTIGVTISTTAGTVQVRFGVGCSNTATGIATLEAPQFEAGNWATSYIPTTSASATRSAERALVSLVSLPGGGLSQTAELFFSAMPLNWSGDQDGVAGWRIAQTPNLNDIVVNRAGASSALVRRNDAGGFDDVTFSHGFAFRVGASIGAAFDATSTRAYVAGATAGTPKAPNTLPYTAVTQLDLGSNAGSSATSFSGYVGCAVLNTEVASDAQRRAMHQACQCSLARFVGIL